MAMFHWDGKVLINGKETDQEFSVSGMTRAIKIELFPAEAEKVADVPVTDNPITENSDEVTYRITVKPYMTQKATPRFDFMAKWNNDNPMPLRMMVGTVEKETRGMVYMHLHGDMYAEQMCTCMKCGRPLTNPVSQYFGIGPECGGHNYVNPFDSDEQLKEAVAEYRKKLLQMEWTGWVIRSAITEWEQV